MTDTSETDPQVGADTPIGEPLAPVRNRGQFVKGNPGPRLTHGGRSVRVRLALIEERRAALAESRAAIIADLGGAENVGRLKADLVERYLETSLIAEWLGGNLLVDGVLTGKGRTRAAATLYLQVLDRLSRLTAALGLERRQKRVDLNAYLADRYSKPQAAPSTAGDSQATPAPDVPASASRESGEGQR